jgi:hypothetical protein
MSMSKVRQKSEELIPVNCFWIGGPAKSPISESAGRPTPSLAHSRRARLSGGVPTRGLAGATSGRATRRRPLHELDFCACVCSLFLCCAICV